MKQSKMIDAPGYPTPKMKRLSRRGFLKTAAIAAPAVVGLRARSAPRRSPNIVYVFSDEHRWQSMQHTEMKQVSTPHMTQLGADGFEFDQCISNYPVCSPYRAILQTGRWPYQQGVIDNKIPLEPTTPTIGTQLRDAGYATGYVGKWHLGGVRAEAHGWDHSLIWTGDGNHRKASYHPSQGGEQTHEGYTVDKKTDQILEFMDANRVGPFCAMVSYNAPHARFTDAPDDLNARYPAGSIPWRPNAQPEMAEKRGGAFRFSEDDYTGYHAHITGVDNALGRIVDAVDEWGITEDTIIIYTSDHGSMFGSHGVGSKRQPYEESIRVPFMCRWTGRIQPGGSSDVLFGSIDLAPTLLSLAGLDRPSAMQGQDYSPWLFGKRGPNPDYQPIMHIQKLNASHGNNHPAPIFRGVRTKRHTYAVFTDRPSAVWDNFDDPYQLDNRYNDETIGDVRRSCQAMTDEWFAAADDPFPREQYEHAPA